MNVICYGDSNTYGYDPRSFFGGRYDADCRWVDILTAKSGWNVRNEGMNGREIPRRAIHVPSETDLLIIMLGTNDLLQGLSAETVSKRMEDFLRGMNIAKEKVLLISPPPMQLGEWVPNQKLIEESVWLRECYDALAASMKVGFADAGAWNIPMAYDGVHFTEEGHKRFAEGLWSVLGLYGFIAV